MQKLTYAFTFPLVTHALIHRLSPFRNAFRYLRSQGGRGAGRCDWASQVLRQGRHYEGIRGYGTCPAYLSFLLLIYDAPFCWELQILQQFGQMLLEPFATTREEGLRCVCQILMTGWMTDDHFWRHLTGSGDTDSSEDGFLTPDHKKLTASQRCVSWSPQLNNLPEECW